MPATTNATYFAEGKFLGTVAISDFSPERQGRHLGFRSYVYICTTCGKEWARVACDPSDAWQAVSRPCRLHRPVGIFDWLAIPGRFNLKLSTDLTVWDQAVAIEHVPLAVLKWEFLREFENFERLQNGE